MKTAELETASIADVVESLRQEVARLSARLAALEKQPAAPEIQSPQPAINPKSDNLNDETIMVISAAIAAYLGVQPHIRQIRLLHSHPWGQQGRVTIQASHQISVQHG